jgi:PhnB protein
MAVRLNPYLNFAGNTAEAMAFYQTVFGGDLQISTFGQFGAPEGVDPNGVMHANLEAPDGMTLMASDSLPHLPLTAGNNFSISLVGDDNAALRGYWDALSEGGQIQIPLGEQAWGDTFGMLTDQFGIQWMVNILGPQSS